MRRRRLPIGFFVPIALALLVGLLAVLQYRWLGQVSAAERERMKATLMQRAEAFGRDFDREVLNLYLALQSESPALAQHDWQSFARRYDTWRDSAEHPQIVTGIYLIEGEDTQRRMWRYEPQTRAFEPSAWPASLSSIQQRIAEHDRLATGSFTGQARTMILMREPIVASIPALLIPLPVVQPLPNPDSNSKFSLRIDSRFVIAQLDRAYLESTMLPAIAARHFPGRDATDYRFAVVEAAPSGTTIFSHGVAKGALNVEKADAVVPFFSLRPDLSNQVTARAMLHDIPSPFNVVTGPPPPPPPAPAAVWFGSGPTARSGGAGANASAPTPASTQRSGGAAMVGRSGTMSIVVEQRGATVTNYRVTQSVGTPAWQLVVQHTAGSLDQAVARARRRNLWLSFGILAVLGSGVGLVVLNARRSERLAAQQMDFVATVSHELRTPLAVIRSAAQNLSAGVVNDAKQARQYGDLIEEEGRRLTDMVEQVLAYAGMSDARGLVTARPADISAIVKDAISTATPFVTSAGFETAIDIEPNLPSVLVDESAIRRALDNLITNALKYGAGGKWLGVSIRRTTGKAGDEVQIAVSDRGRGIDAQDLPHIFEPFYRGRFAVDQQIHGNGLGLSLVKRIAEAHGGRVTVRSPGGEGTTFTLHLPIFTAIEDVADAGASVPADVAPGFPPSRDALAEARRAEAGEKP
jgi:two-component system, OmpR family, sensor histidine kinase SenX3